jgi:hypothetical protein
MALEISLQQIYITCGWHEKAIKNSNCCCCIYCVCIYSPTEIETWVDEPESKERTAICPKCGADAVIPESEHYKTSIEFLEELNKEYF